MQLEGRKSKRCCVGFQISIYNLFISYIFLGKKVKKNYNRLLVRIKFKFVKI